MPVYPPLTHYRDTVEAFFDTAVLDPKLRGGKAKLNNRGKPLSYSGAYSVVFEIKVGHNKTYALRCWTQEVEEAQERYQKIGDFLVGLNLPYFVDCKYVNDGIRVGGEEYPTTRMEWVEGQTLCKFVEQNLGNSKIFKTVADKFAKMVNDLHRHKIAHGDLQDGNILLLQNGTNIEIKLIDYDSLYVPTLGRQPDNIVGLKNYQHPQRMKYGGQSNEKVDYFSELVIYLSFRSLSENPALWRQFVGSANTDIEQRLLFQEDDFKNPNQSKVLQELAKMSPEVQHLASTLKAFCVERSIDNLKPLENVLQPSSTRSAPSPSKPQSKIPQTARDYYNQGMSHLRADQPNYAVRQFKEAIKLRPNYTDAYYYCGFAHFKLKQLTPAKNALEEVLKIDSNYKTARDLLQDVNREIQWNLRFQKRHYDTALNFYNQGALQKAKDEVEKALKINPNYKSARDLLQDINNHPGKRSISAPIRKKTTPTRQTSAPIRRTSTPTSKRNYQNAQQLLKSINWQKNRRTYLASVAVIAIVVIFSVVRFNTPSGTIESGTIERNNGNDTTAQKPLITPIDYAQIGYNHLDNEEYYEAIDALQKAISNDQGDEKVYNSLGIAYYKTQEYEAAITAFQEGIILNPELKYLHNNLGWAYFKANKFEDAKSAAEEVLKIDPNYESARQLLEAIPEELKPKLTPKLSMGKLSLVEPSGEGFLDANETADIKFTVKNSGGTVSDISVWIKWDSTLGLEYDPQVIPILHQNESKTIKIPIAASQSVKGRDLEVEVQLMLKNGEILASRVFYLTIRPWLPGPVH